MFRKIQREPFRPEQAFVAGKAAAKLHVESKPSECGRRRANVRLPAPPLGTRCLQALGREKLSPAAEKRGFDRSFGSVPLRADTELSIKTSDSGSFNDNSSDQ